MALRSELTERTLYELIRLNLVTRGYLPDFLSYPNNPIGKSQYEAAKQTIKNSKGFYIELKGSSDQDSRGNKYIPRIVILPQEPSNSETIGMDTSRDYILTGDGKYDETKYPQNAMVDHFININLVSETTTQRRLLSYIVDSCIPKMGYVRDYLNLGPLLIENIGRSVLDDNDNGLFERALSYKIADQYDEDPLILSHQIVPINEITIDMYFNNELKASSFTITT